MTSKHKHDGQPAELPAQEEDQPVTSAPEPVRMKRKAYRAELAALQVRLGRLQEWITGRNLRAVIILEGLGPAGKRGTGQRIAESLDRQLCQIVTLPPVRKRERGQWHFQRYVEHFPTAGKLVIFDGSWYHLPAMEHALGLSEEAEFAEFLQACAEFERSLVRSGVQLIKYWFTADSTEQDRRFRAHIEELRKDRHFRLPQGTPGKLVDVAAVQAVVLTATDTQAIPWHVIPADDKRQARLACLAHLLHLATQALAEPG